FLSFRWHCLIQDESAVPREVKGRSRMAKRKHVALFEVIQKDKRFERQKRSVVADAPPATPGRDGLARLQAAWNDFSRRISPRWDAIKPHLARQSGVLAGAATALVMIG